MKGSEQQTKSSLGRLQPLTFWQNVSRDLAPHGPRVVLGLHSSIVGDGPMYVRSSSFCNEGSRRYLYEVQVCILNLLYQRFGQRFVWARFDRSPATAVVDTGTSLIEGPYDDVGALAKKIGASCVSFTSSSAADFVSAAYKKLCLQLLRALLLFISPPCPLSACPICFF